MRKTSAAKTVPRTKPPSAREAVLAAGKRLGNAIRRGDKATADKLMARDFSFIDASGKVHARASVLAKLKPSPDKAESKPRVTVYGRVALITGGVKSAQAKTKDDLYAIDIWIKRDDAWTALIHHDNVLARKSAPPAHAAPTPRPPGAKPPACRNPIEFVPYQPKSQAERDIIAAFQALERAVTHNDAAEWRKHVADEFVVTRTGQHPTSKADRVGFIAAQEAVNGETWVAEVTRMKLWVLDDAAVMRADHAMPGNRRPPYRATRVWVRRDGRWQMAMSQQTTIAE